MGGRGDPSDVGAGAGRGQDRGGRGRGRGVTTMLVDEEVSILFVQNDSSF